MDEVLFLTYHPVISATDGQCMDKIKDAKYIFKIWFFVLFFTRFYFVKLDRESINNHLSPHVLLHEFDPYQILFTTKIKFMRVGVKLQLDEGAILKKKYWQLFLLNRFELRLLWIFAFNPTNTAHSYQNTVGRNKTWMGSETLWVWLF